MKRKNWFKNWTTFNLYASRIMSARATCRTSWDSRRGLKIDSVCMCILKRLCRQCVVKPMLGREIHPSYLHSYCYTTWCCILGFRHIWCLFLMTSLDIFCSCNKQNILTELFSEVAVGCEIMFCSSFASSPICWVVVWIRKSNLNISCWT